MDIPKLKRLKKPSRVVLVIEDYYYGENKAAGIFSPLKQEKSDFKSVPRAVGI